MATTTILDSGLPGNSHSGAIPNRRPGVPAYREQVVYAVPADPNSPGAYRYDPDSADPTIPDSDPRSPRYEPPHLRHRPGDTWIIDRQRPHDPLDPGPYGSPGWYADKRTGRHRRGELPDSPPESEPTDRRSPGSAPEGAEKPRPMPGRSGGEPPQPPKRSRFWEEDDDGHRYNFGTLREDAWSHFLVDSEELHDVHLIRKTTVGDRWLQFWETLQAFLLRVIGVRVSGKSVQRSWEPLTPMPGRATGEVEPPIRVEWQRGQRANPGAEKGAVVGKAKVKGPSLMSGTPTQGAHRTNSINPYIAQWERHFDAAQSFREAVAL